MHPGRGASRLAIAAALATAALAACGDDDEVDGSATTTGAPLPAGGVSLRGDCPDTVVIQTDWMPEAEHGFVYQLVGDGYEIDAANARVRGPLVDAEGNDTGVDVEVRSGGPAVGFVPPAEVMYTDEDVLLGFVYTDEAIKFSATRPTVAIESGFEKNPLMIMWDPETYPNVETIADLGTTDAVVRYLGGVAYMDYFTSQGILKPSQVDPSYTGDPSLFVADEGRSAQQGFGSAEPYNYENIVPGWGKPVRFQYIYDAGWKNYAQSIATRPENIEEHRACFTKLVPLIQRASVAYLDDPDRTTAIILDAVEAFGTDFGWTYVEGTAQHGVRTMREDGLVANGPDGVIGNFDLQRVEEMIEIATPIYTAQDNPPAADLSASDIVTNEFIDDTIGL